MKNNVGTKDQTIRYVLAMILSVIAIFTNLWWLLIPAVILALTAAFSFCGLYRVFGINTCKFDPKE